MNESAKLILQARGFLNKNGIDTRDLTDDEIKEAIKVMFDEMMKIFEPVWEYFKEFMQEQEKNNG